MLLFRSEDHVERWCATQGLPRGESFTLAQAWELAKIWYADRLDPTWRRKAIPEAEARFAGIGLRSEFWRLRP